MNYPGNSLCDSYFASPHNGRVKFCIYCFYIEHLDLNATSGGHHAVVFPEHYASKRLTRTVLIFTERSDQLSKVTDRVPGLPTSPGYVQCRNAAIFPAPHYSDGMCRSASTAPPHVCHHCRNPRRASSSGLWPLPVRRSLRCCCRFPPTITAVHVPSIPLLQQVCKRFCRIRVTRQCFHLSLYPVVQ